MFGSVFNYVPGPMNGMPPMPGAMPPVYGGGPNPFMNATMQQDAFLRGQQQPQKSKGVFGAIKDFGKGIIGGAVNTVKNLFSPKGMLLALGSAAAVWLAAPIAVPALIAAGLGFGGYQVAKGVSSGNWQKAGEGTFAIGATLLGARFGPKTAKGADGVKYAVGDGKTGNFLSPAWNQLKSLFGGKLHAVDKSGAVLADVPGKNIFQLGKESFTGRLSSIKNIFSGNKPAPTPPSRAKAFMDNLSERPTPKTSIDDLGVDYRSAAHRPHVHSEIKPAQSASTPQKTIWGKVKHELKNQFRNVADPPLDMGNHDQKVIGSGVASTGGILGAMEQNNQRRGNGAF